MLFLIFRQSLVVQRPINTNPGLNFDSASLFLYSGVFFGIIFPIPFRPSNHQIVDKKKENGFLFKFSDLKSNFTLILG